MRATTVRLLAASVAFLAIAGCTRGTSDLHQWVAQEKAKKGAPLPPVPVIRTFESFEYKDQDKRDPFAPSPIEQQQTTTQSGPRPDQDRKKQPLEAFSLDSLKMVGTFGTGSGMVALVVDSSKRIYRVHLNDYIGQNYGRVTGISEDHIDLVELVPNGNGGWMERQASVALDVQ